MRNPPGALGLALLVAALPAAGCNAVKHAPISAWASDFAREPDRALALPLDREESEWILLNTLVFADVGVNAQGETSLQAQAFGVLLRDPDADRIFKAALSEAYLAGQLYALCGIYFTDNSLFEEMLPQYASRRESVTTHIGCIRSQQETREIVRQADELVVELRDADDTICDWVNRTPGAWERGYVLDIAGGGWPATFREFAERPDSSCEQHPN